MVTATSSFKREHHQAIAQVLQALNAELLREHHCWFGGGTAISLLHREFRESVDIDFLVSDLNGYRQLRQKLTGNMGFAAILKSPYANAVHTLREIRADQYGIRTLIGVADRPIKFEIVLEARITLETPPQEQQVCGVVTLTKLDMVTSKLLANSDRWADDAVLSRDLIDLALMEAAPYLETAMAKASHAYGTAIQRDFHQAIERFLAREGWAKRCLQAMQIQLSPTELTQKIAALR